MLINLEKFQILTWQRRIHSKLELLTLSIFQKRVLPNFPETTKFPDFMEKPDKPVYESKKVLGVLYRSITELLLWKWRIPR